MLMEKAGTADGPVAIENYPGSRCSLDNCVFEIERGERRWRILATRTAYPIPAMEMAAACKRVDIVVSDRWLPSSCRPRWIKADRNMLEQSGGIAFYLAKAQLITVNGDNAHLPWVQAARQAQASAQPDQ
jgi:competence protein ComEC